MRQLTSVGIVPRTTYDFRELRSGTVKVPIAQQIDVAGATGLALELWVDEAAICAEASVTLRAANDGYSPETQGSSVLQTRTAQGKEICMFTIDSNTSLPLYQLIRIPAEEIGRCLAVILEARGGPDGGPHLSLAIDLLLRGTNEAGESMVSGVQSIVTSPQGEEVGSGPAMDRIAYAARQATARAPRRYARWREIVV
jgi:hypothetical protein